MLQQKNESVREKRKNEQIVELKLKKKGNVHMEEKIEREKVREEGKHDTELDKMPCYQL